MSEWIGIKRVSRPMPGLVADRLQRNAILIELNPEYAAMAERRVRGDAPLFAEASA